jgi:hypothetical protein
MPRRPPTAGASPEHRRQRHARAARRIGDELRAAGGNQARLTSTGTAGRRRLSVLSARLRDIDERTAPRPGSLARQLQLANPHFDTAQWRALAATSAVSELAAQAASHENVAPWLQQEHERQQHRLPPNAAPVPRRHPAIAGRVACRSGRPQREIADLWLRTVAVQAAGHSSALPPPLQKRCTARTPRRRWPTCWAAAATPAPCTAIVIAAASHLSENGIGRLSNAEWPVLCHASARPHPRRGAAGLLLADAAQAALLTGGDEQPAASAAQCQRDSCADTARRDTDTCLASTASALQAAQVDGGAIAAVTADTGHRTSRVTELMHVVTAAAPQLDPGADVISIGSSCGSCGAVTWLTALGGGCGSTGPRRSCALHQ